MELVARILSILVVLLAACSRDDSRGVNVVVVGIDTLRADHVGAYGYPRPTTPRIDAFARDAVRFQRAVSQASWTLPGFASLFTGLVPSMHGAGEGRCPRVSMLDDMHETLATVLHAAGYETAAFVSNAWVGAEVGMARGFDRHEEMMFSADAVERAIAWMRGPHRAPVFLFVHIVDPHQPWIPAPEDARLFLDPAYEGPIGSGFAGVANPEWNDADRRRIVDLYDGEVRWADRLTGQVLDTLDDLGLASRTIVVVVSDHGEELFEHGRLGHGHTLYDELLLVPFLIRFPGERPRGVITVGVRTMDLFPTILEALGRPVPTGLNAVSLMPLLHGGALPQTEVAVSENPCFADAVMLKSLRTPREKLLFDPVGERAQLFDLVADPHETTDVAASHPARVAALRKRLSAETRPVPQGFHLIARGGAERSLMRVRLETAGAFRDVSMVQAERADGFRLRRRGTLLEVKLRLTPRRRPITGGDVDEVVVRTKDDRPLVVQGVDLNGTPLPPARISLGDGSRAPSPTRLPVVLEMNLPGLAVHRPVPPPTRRDWQPSLRIAVVRAAPAPNVALTPEMEKRLRALGYVP